MVPTGPFLFPVAMTETLTKATLRRKGLFQLRVQVTVIYSRKPQQQELQGAHHIPREGRKARVHAGLRVLSSVLRPDLGNGVTGEVTHLNGL